MRHLILNMLNRYDERIEINKIALGIKRMHKPQFQLAHQTDVRHN